MTADRSEVPAERPHVSAPGDATGVSTGRRRATKADLRRRRDLITELLGAGLPGERIVQRVTATYGISERQARRDVAAVLQQWSATLVTEEPHRRTRLLATLECAIAGAMEDRAWGAVLAGLRDLARLCGIEAANPPQVLTMGLSADEAASRIEHAYSCLQLARRRAQAAAAAADDLNYDGDLARNAGNPP